MSRPKEQPARETRITMQIVVDAYDEVERAIGWHCYLEDTLQFPFGAECSVRRPISPLKVGDRVTVIGMAPSEECEREMFVTIRWDDDSDDGEGELAVPLAQLKPLRASRETKEAVEDWRYWVSMGYQF